jgi:hypothetical protein
MRAGIAGRLRLTDEKLREIESRTYSNAVAILAALPTHEVRRRVLEVYEAARGSEAADKLRRDVWALMQGARVNL